MEKILGILFVLFGAASIINPKWTVAMKVWSSKHIAGAELIPTQKTYRAFRIIGIGLLAIGLLLFNE
jgi:hypothetical protein